MANRGRMNWCKWIGHKFVTVYDEHPRDMTGIVFDGVAPIKSLLNYSTVHSTYCKRCGRSTDRTRSNGPEPISGP